MKLRPYQQELADRCTAKIKELGIVYLAAEVRTGKTLTSLTVGLNYKKVLFVTKKKAVPSILEDYKNIGYSYDLTVINYESLHKLPKVEYDLVILDEAHTCSAYPKVPKRVKQLVDIVNNDLLLMSGTPHPESWSQIFHQFFVSKRTPFKDYRTFYKWAGTLDEPNFVNVKQKQAGIYRVNDYSQGNKEMIDKYVKKYFITFTQKEAGFTSSVQENIIDVEMKPSTYKLADKLKKDKVVEGKAGVILADTAAKEMQKLHQIYSGTCKLEEGISVTIDNSKALAIKEKFKGKKIGIFYKFVQEKEMLKEVFGDSLCFDLEEFNSTDKNIALQIVSGREGISLKNADLLIFLNIDFSATSYFQALDRMTTMERPENTIYWVFAKRGIERQIYSSVKKKKNFTLSVYKNNNELTNKS